MTDKRYLTRKQGAEFLREIGFPMTDRYFEQLCVPGCGEGPPVACWFGRRALYTPESLLIWAENRCMAPDSPRIWKKFQEPGFIDNERRRNAKNTASHRYKASVALRAVKELGVDITKIGGDQ